MGLGLTRENGAHVQNGGDDGEETAGKDKEGAHGQIIAALGRDQCAYILS